MSDKCEFGTPTMEEEYFKESIPSIVMRTLFQKYDVTYDGGLSKDELIVLMENDLGLTLEQIEVPFWLEYKNGKDKLQFDEFRECLEQGIKVTRISPDSRYSFMVSAIEMFRGYDTDRNKILDVAEFTQLHANCGGNPDHVIAALNILDRDGNGGISFYEFKKWLNWVNLEQL